MHVGLIYGGRSSEHEISILSARSVFTALDPQRYRVTPIRIDLKGRWHVEQVIADGPTPEQADEYAYFSPAETGAEVLTGRGSREDDAERLRSLGLDVAFPILHGQNGEDGRIQGFLNTLGIPFVGTGVLGSAVCMDKEVTKRLVRDAGLPGVAFQVVRRGASPSFEELTGLLGPTLFVKPANSGSSVGTARVENADQLERAIEDAFRYDDKVLVETAIAGREIECGVIGNDEPRTSVPGEIVATAEFYTYDAKYKDPDAARMVVPADLPPDVADRARAIAAEAYTVLGCEGMARVDFFLTSAHEILINEVNTIPGFTARSMFPVMWENTGLPIGALVDTLIELAVERHARQARIQTTR
jgi:D-alanine-D-alanine ligase